MIVHLVRTAVLFTSLRKMTFHRELDNTHPSRASLQSPAFPQQISMAHNYRTVNEANTALRLAGYEIARGHMPTSIGPLTFVINGTGNVAKGAQMILEQLPARYIKPEELPRMCESGGM